MKQVLKLLSLLVLTGTTSVSWSNALSLEDILATTPELRSELPSPTTATGVAVGERHWYHHEIVDYSIPLQQRPLAWWHLDLMPTATAGAPW